MKYRKLPIDITQNGGHHYKQVWRDEHAAVYEQYGAFGQFIGYEAIAVKKTEAGNIMGRDYPARETYPNSEDWGTYAISVSDLDRAMEAAKAFSKRQQESLSKPDATSV
jgi:hypothetical protein